MPVMTARRQTGPSHLGAPCFSTLPRQSRAVLEDESFDDWNVAEGPVQRIRKRTIVFGGKPLVRRLAR
jgi:hypothetical protein